VATGQSFSQSVTDLTPGSTYYFNAKAKNSGGESAWGAEQSFVNPPVVPNVSTYAEKDVGATTALLEGCLVDDGGADCEYRFRYWAKGDTEKATAWSPTSEGSTFAEHVQDLQPGTLYSFAAEARNSAGVANGGTRMFTTTAADKLSLAISSSLYGSVTRPGEGVYSYDSIRQVQVEATPQGPVCVAGRPWCVYFSFYRWSGSAVDAGRVQDHNSAVTTVLVDDSYTLNAIFTTSNDTIHVVAGALMSSVPGDPDPDGTIDNPIGTIQDAILVAPEGGTVTVHPGTYYGSIVFQDRGVSVIGMPSTPSGSQFMSSEPPIGELGLSSHWSLSESEQILAYPVIDANGMGTAVSFVNIKKSAVTLTGFVITGGKGGLAGAIYCDGASPTVSNCIIVGNRATDPNGGAIYCQDSNALFANCTIAGNYGGAKGAGLRLQNSLAVVTNSIIWGNTPAEVLATGPIQPVVTYTDVAGGWLGLTNVNADPLFAMPGYWANPSDLTKVVAASDPTAVWVHGDYHLMSKAGRWDPVTKTWVKDAVTSPCIDAGDPASLVGAEPMPNGNRINMGAYGGSRQASLSQ